MEVEITEQDHQVLGEAFEAYYGDLRETADEETAGWRMPWFFSGAVDLQRLVSLELMEHDPVSNTYRITSHGQFVSSEWITGWDYAEPEQPAAPAQPATGGGADAYGDKYNDLERFNAELDKLRSASTWYSYPLSKMYLDAIEWRDEARDAHKVMDAQKAELATLRTQLADANARAAAAEAALTKIRDWRLPSRDECTYSDRMLEILNVEMDNPRRIAKEALEARPTAGE